MENETRNSINKNGSREAAIAYHDKARAEYLALSVECYQKGELDLLHACMIQQAYHAKMMGKLRAL